MVTSTPAATFRGFPPAALGLLRQVRAANDRDWLAAHREQFDRQVIDPFRALVTALAELMLDIDPGFEVRPTVGRTISRVHRDTRFSRDKSLYRDHMWLAFKRPRSDWQGWPAYFFEVTPDDYRYGMGYYAAGRATMDALRRRIDSNPSGFLRTVGPVVREGRFRIAGDRYVRPIHNPHGQALQDWYQSKSFYLVRECAADELLFSPELLDELESGFHLLAPLYRALLEVGQDAEGQRGRGDARRGGV